MREIVCNVYVLFFLMISDAIFTHSRVAFCPPRLAPLPLPLASPLASPLPHHKRHYTIQGGEWDFLRAALSTVTIDELRMELGHLWKKNSAADPTVNTLNEYGLDCTVDEVAYFEELAASEISYINPLEKKGRFTSKPTILRFFASLSYAVQEGSAYHWKSAFAKVSFRFRRETEQRGKSNGEREALRDTCRSRLCKTETTTMVVTQSTQATAEATMRACIADPKTT